MKRTTIQVLRSIGVLISCGAVGYLCTAIGYDEGYHQAAVTTATVLKNDPKLLDEVTQKFVEFNT